MLGLIVVALLGGLAIFYRKSLENSSLDLPAKLSEKMDGFYYCLIQKAHA